MSLYGFYIFDRHAECIYVKRWLKSPISTQMQTNRHRSAVNTQQSGKPKLLSSADDAKLLFGAIYSLRRMVQQLGGQDDSFLAYQTGEYKLHYFETATSLKFVMLTDTSVGNMRTVLHQIWANLYVEYVVKNPIAPVEHHAGVGVANELFEGGLDSFMVALYFIFESRTTADMLTESDISFFKGIESRFKAIVHALRKCQ